VGADENWACRIECRGCGRPAPDGVLRRARAADAKAKEEKAKKRVDQGKQSDKPASGAGGDKQRLAIERELKELKAQLKERDEELAEVRARGAVGDDDMGVDGDPLADAVAKARDALKAVKDVPEAGRPWLAGGYEKCVAERQAALDAALAARRASNPLDKQLEGAEAYKARRLKKVEEEKELLAEKQAEADEAIARLEDQKKELAEAERKAAEATAEVAELAARYAAERSAATPRPPSPNPAAASAEVGDTVSRAYAEQVWLEREAEFKQQLEQVQSMLVAAQDGVAGAASAASESAAGDLGSLDDLVDDDRWTKVEGAKRKAFLVRAAGRKKAEFAACIQTKLGKHRMVASPFDKKK